MKEALLRPRKVVKRALIENVDVIPQLTVQVQVGLAGYCAIVGLGELWVRWVKLITIG